MDQRKKVTRVVYFDLLRIISVFSVVFLHVAARNFYAVELASLEWSAFNLFDSAVRWCVPVLVMISGALFLDEHAVCSLKKLYFKTILRMVTAFVFWSALYAFDSFLSGAKLKKVIFSFFEGHFHLWFIFMIVGIYVLVPVIRSITWRPEVEKYALVVGFVFAFFLPDTVSFLEVVPQLKNSLLLKTASKMLANLNFRMMSSYVYYFILGHYIHRHMCLKKKGRYAVYFVGILAMILTIIFTELYSKYKGVADSRFYGNLSLRVFAMSVAFFTFGKYELNRIKLSSKALTAVTHLSECCFGIYLVHVLVRDKIDMIFGWDSLTFNPFINVPLLSIVVFFVSYFISTILKKIPLLQKYIV